MIGAFDKPEQAQASGVRLAGQKFFTLQCNARSLYGKKQASTAEIPPTTFLADTFLEADGCVLVKTKQAILVAEYVAPVQAPEATPIVEGLADYLISTGY